ncbi:hypothetical protein DXG03_007492 [Asterophora parasitica]|uniref:Uncharacterized protein n=1 Tax=Asterophora parasitica TaxID=117018 RepID=A0A9P7K921_9AGAR|nr:hypothetical protein DXG03_007492 [Asterophora parasitica]
MASERTVIADPELAQEMVALLGRELVSTKKTIEQLRTEMSVKVGDTPVRLPTCVELMRRESCHLGQELRAADDLHKLKDQVTNLKAEAKRAQEKASELEAEAQFARERADDTVEQLQEQVDAQQTTILLLQAEIETLRERAEWRELKVELPWQDLANLKSEIKRESEIHDVVEEVSNLMVVTNGRLTASYLQGEIEEGKELQEELHGQNPLDNPDFKTFMENLTRPEDVPRSGKPICSSASDFNKLKSRLTSTDRIVDDTVVGIGYKDPIRSNITKVLKERYNSGELKVTCLVLECIGFNHTLYENLRGQYFEAEKRQRDKEASDKALPPFKKRKT